MGQIATGVRRVRACALTPLTSLSLPFIFNNIIKTVKSIEESRKCGHTGDNDVPTLNLSPSSGSQNEVLC